MKMGAPERHPHGGFPPTKQPQDLATYDLTVPPDNQRNRREQVTLPTRNYHQWCLLSEPGHENVLRKKIHSGKWQWKQESLLIF
jgi:hypothetical protein